MDINDSRQGSKAMTPATGGTLAPGGVQAKERTPTTGGR